MHAGAGAGAVVGCGRLELECGWSSLARKDMFRSKEKLNHIRVKSYIYPTSILMTVVVVEPCSSRNLRMGKQLQKSPSANPKIANGRSMAKKSRM